jgi:hypothetical protein
MSDIAVFVVGCLVTSICLAAVALLLWGAYQDSDASAAKSPTQE